MTGPKSTRPSRSANKGNGSEQPGPDVAIEKNPPRSRRVETERHGRDGDVEDNTKSVHDADSDDGFVSIPQHDDDEADFRGAALLAAYEGRPATTKHRSDITSSPQHFPAPVSTGKLSISQVRAAAYHKRFRPGTESPVSSWFDSLRSFRTLRMVAASCVLVLLFAQYLYGSTKIPLTQLSQIPPTGIPILRPHIANNELDLASATPAMKPRRTAADLSDEFDWGHSDQKQFTAASTDDGGKEPSNQNPLVMRDNANTLFEAEETKPMLGNEHQSIPLSEKAKPVDEAKQGQEPPIEEANSGSSPPKQIPQPVGETCLSSLVRFNRSGYDQRFEGIFFRKPIDSAYNLSESPFIGSIIVPEHKLLLCTVPKASCSNMRALLVRLHSIYAKPEPDKNWTSNGKPIPPLHTLSHSWQWAQYNQVREYHRQLRHLPASEIEKIATDPSWLKVAIVRNPFTRLVSGYQEKVKSGKVRVARLPEGANATFEQFVDAISSVKYQHEVNEHFRPQSSLCGFDYIDYDYIIQIEKNLEQQVRCVASKAGFLHLVDSGWGPNGDQSLFSLRFGHERTIPDGATGELGDSHKKDKMLYNRELVRKVYLKYITDFVWFQYSAESGLE